MQIGDMIRKYRIAKNMTQEEMAYRLGVTTPAVNKWENGKTLPDIGLLAPIARLLDTDIDTLLSFHEELTTEEINGYIQELSDKMKKGNFQDGFAYGKSLIEKYPNCEMLKWQVASVLQAHYIMKQVSDTDYENYIYRWLVSVLETSDEKIRNHAADSLYGYHIRKCEYDKAEDMLKYFSEQNPERKRKKAEIYQNRGNIEEAYIEYEELLFSYYQMCSMVLNGLCNLAMQDNDMENAHYYINKQEDLAKIFEMGKYHEISGKLSISSVEDRNAVEEIAKDLIGCADTIMAFTSAPLYRHMKFKEVKSDFVDELRAELTENMKKEGYFQK